MQSHSLKKLEFSNVLTMLLSFCQTYMGKDICTHLLPYHTQEEVEEKLQETKHTQPKKKNRKKERSK